MLGMRSKKAGLRVVSDYNLDFADVILTSDQVENIITHEDLLRNSIVLIDEAPTFLDSRESQTKTNRQQTRFYQHVRKLDLHVAYSTQFSDMVDKRLRNFTTFWYYPRPVRSTDIRLLSTFPNARKKWADVLKSITTYEHELAQGNTDPHAEYGIAEYHQGSWSMMQNGPTPFTMKGYVFIDGKEWFKHYQTKQVMMRSTEHSRASALAQKKHLGKHKQKKVQGKYD